MKTKILVGALVLILVTGTLSAVALATGSREDSGLKGALASHATTDGINQPDTPAPRVEAPAGFSRPVRGLQTLGIVIEIGGQTLTVDNVWGTFDILTNERTRYRIPGVAHPALEDIKTNDRAVGLIHRQDDGSLLAEAVAIVRPARSRVGLGTVLGVEGQVLAVHHQRGDLRIFTDAETTFRVPGVQDPSLRDIKAGERIAGRVVKQNDGSLLAKVIVVIPPR